VKSIKVLILALILSVTFLASEQIVSAQDQSSGGEGQEQVTRRPPPDKPNLLPGSDPVMNNLYRNNSDTLGAAASLRNRFGIGENYSPLNSALSAQEGEENAEGALYLDSGARGNAFVAAPSNAASVYENPQTVGELNRVQKSPMFLKASTGLYVNPVYMGATDLVLSASHGKLNLMNTARVATVESNKGEGSAEGIDTYMGCIAENALLGQDVAQMLCSNDPRIFTGNPPPNTNVGMNFSNNRSNPLNTANTNNNKFGATAQTLRFSDVIFTQAISTLKEQANTLSGQQKADALASAEQLEKFRTDLQILLGDAMLKIETKPNGVFEIKTTFAAAVEPYETILFKRHDDAYNRMLWLLQQRCLYANSRSNAADYKPFEMVSVTLPFVWVPIYLPKTEGFYSPGVGQALYKDIREQFGYLSLNQSFLFSQEILEVFFQLFEQESTRVTEASSNGDASSSGGGGTRGTANKYQCDTLDYEKNENKLIELIKKVKNIDGSAYSGPSFISDRLKLSARMTEVVSHAQVIEAMMLLQERMKQLTTVANVNDQIRNALYGAIDSLVRRAARLRSDESLESRYSLLMKDLSELLMTLVQLSQSDKGKSGQYFGHLMTGRESGADSALTGR